MRVEVGCRPIGAGKAEANDVVDMVTQSGSERPLEISIEELIALADAALRSQPGCASARVLELRSVRNAGHGRNWEIPQVALGDSLISDVDRAVLSVHRQLGRKYRLLTRP